MDIGSSAIKACVFAEEDQTLQLKSAYTVDQGWETLQGGAIIHLGKTIEHVQEAVKKAENIAKKSPKQVILGVSGELVKGSTLSLDYQRSKPEERIDAQELKTIIYELQWQAFDTIRKHISDEMSIREMDLKLINASIISIQVDGVAVTDPRGSTGKVVNMEIFNCFAPLQHFGHLQSIAVELPYHELKGVFIQSFAVCHALSLQNTLESAVVVDIGAGTTDVSVIVDGKIVGSRSFALAGNTLTKRISYELSTPFSEAESIKLSYAKKELEKRSQQVIHNALQDDIEVWVSSLDFCLKELPIKKLPSKFLLCGQASHMEEFSEALENYDWTSHFPIETKVRVRQLDYRDVLGGDLMDKNFDLQYLPLISVAYTAYDLLYNNTAVEEFMQTIIADKH